MIEVIMYTKNECPNCARAEMLFNFCPVEISVEKRNIEDPKEGAKHLAEIKGKDIMSVPSFVIDGQWIEGFNEGKVKGALGL